MLLPRSLPALSSLAVGGAGMLISFVYMWSPNLLEGALAGFAFIAAALLVGAGVIAYTLTEKQQ